MQRFDYIKTPASSSNVRANMVDSDADDAAADVAARLTSSSKGRPPFKPNLIRY
jgi:hypothetical protein